MDNYSSTDSIFDDIRPYRDDEVGPVLQKLVNNGNFEIGLFSLMGKYISFYRDDERDSLLRQVKEKFSKIRSVDEFQREIVLKHMLEPMIKNTIDSLSSSGIEKLSKDETYLFIGNHRDITLDPALLNYFLMNNGLKTVEIAFGDNLLINDFVSDMIRLNKSFIVKRNLPLVRQLDASIHLSKYIFHTITQKRPVWIAQREGRAKDGNDFTNPAVLSMLHLSRRDSGLSVEDYAKKVKIVPVAVSYEYDPCDRLKALEIAKSRSTGPQEKNETDDLISMNLGITGYKGRVHYSAAEPLDITVTAVKDMVNAIDKSIQLSYHLWPANYIAFDRLNETLNYSSFYSREEKLKFDERLKRYSPEIKLLILEGYANPVKNYQQHIR